MRERLSRNWKSFLVLKDTSRGKFKKANKSHFFSIKQHFYLRCYLLWLVDNIKKESIPSNGWFSFFLRYSVAVLKTAGRH